MGWVELLQLSNLTGLLHLFICLFPMITSCLAAHSCFTMVLEIL